MRPQNLLLLALALGVAGAGALAWRQYQELVVLRATDRDAQDRAALEARLAEMKKRNYELQTALAAARAEKRPANAPADDEAAKPKFKPERDEAALAAKLAALAADGDPASKRDEDLELLAAMSELPEFQKLLALEQRGKVDEKYAALFRRLKLTPEELARVQGLLADRQSAFSDALMAARAQGLTGKDARQVANEVARATQKDITSSLRDVLGPQRFAQLQNYERTAPQRETVEQLATRLSYTGAPLTPRQQDQLVQVLASSGPAKVDANGAPIANKNGVVKTPPGNVAPLPGTVAGLGLGASNGSTLISSSAIGAAQSILSPPQLAALQRMQQEQQAQQTIGNLLRTGTVNAPAKNKAPKPKG